MGTVKASLFVNFQQRNLSSGWHITLVQTSRWLQYKGCILVHWPHTKTELLFWCQREVWTNVMCHPVLRFQWKSFLSLTKSPNTSSGLPCQCGYFPVAAERGVVRGRLPRLVQDGLVLPREFLDPARDRGPRPLDVRQLAGWGAQDVFTQRHLWFSRVSLIAQ